MNASAMRQSHQAKLVQLTLPSSNFRALLNLFSKVLCVFPSQYLFAIGLKRELEL